MSTGIVLMTAMPPTLGHKALIDFAEQVMYATGDHPDLYVIVSTRSHEPYVKERIEALSRHYASSDVVQIIHHQDDNAPQNPSGPGDDAFWIYWQKVIRHSVISTGVSKTNKVDYVFASELYGASVAFWMGATFIPFDISRTINHVKATEVRSDPYKHFQKILPEFRIYLQTRVTFFGMESCGKTTLSKNMQQLFFKNAIWLPEWARPYLETVGDELSQDKMNTIFVCQHAMQLTQGADYPLILQDTDLFSTIGYQQYYNMGEYNEMWSPIALNSQSDLYIMMNDRIPFEPDPLRYGGDKRETTQDYWDDIANSFNLNTYWMQSTELDSQYHEAFTQINKAIGKKVNPLKEFIRET